MDDLQKLKDLFDEIGVNYYYTQIESIGCLLVNNYKCKFNFKNDKFTDVSIGDNMNAQCTKCGIFLGIGSSYHECESIADPCEPREQEYTDIEQKAHDLVDAMIEQSISDCKISIYHDDRKFSEGKAYTITIKTEDQ